MSYGKEEIIQLSKKLATKFGIDASRVVFVAGAAMVMHGLKTRTADFDLTMGYFTLEKLLQHCNRDKITVHRFKFGQYVGYKIPELGIDVSTKGYDQLSQDNAASVLIDGVRIQGLSSILELKKEMNRAKDLEDIATLKAAILAS